MAKISSLAVLLFSAETILATPISQSGNTLNIGNNKRVHWPEGRPLPVKITKTPSGHQVGWVKKEDQVNGKIASPPPLKDLKFSGKKEAIPELAAPGAETGPAGTVPFQLLSVEDVQKIPTKKPPPSEGATHEKRAGNGHYYGNSAQTVTNYGGCSYLSCFEPAVATSGSMSLIQVAVSNNAQGYGQTAESGWQVLPVLNNGSYAPHVFTYYTTNGYQTQGDNQGGYNTLVKGFVQTSNTSYPGMTFSSYSTVAGTQYSFQLVYQYFQSNWWVGVNNQWLGYYPGTLYAKTQSGCSSPCTTKTLGAYADHINYYGEVYDDPAAPPKSDMGSGQFANQEFGKAAYMHNLTYYTQINGAGSTNYNGATGISNASWYTIEPHFNSGSSWGSYFYVGGPGAG